MKRITIILMLCLIPLATATSNIDIDLDTTEDLNANIDLAADGDINVNINGQGLASKEYITSLGDGGARNKVVSIFIDAISRIRDGTIFNPLVHEQTQAIGAALLTTFITRSEEDLDWLYYKFRARLVEDIANGEIDRLVALKKE